MILTTFAGSGLGSAWGDPFGPKKAALGRSFAIFGANETLKWWFDGYSQYTVYIYTYIYTVASMLLIFPCVRLDCVSSASKTCLDYVWSVNVFMLSVWAILPAQVSLPFLVEVVSLLHNWIRSPSRPLNEDHVDLVCVSVQIWGPGLHFGVLIWVIFWSLFRVPFLGTVLGPYNYIGSQPVFGISFTHLV